jgi:hypothetical protein
MIEMDCSLLNPLLINALVLIVDSNFLNAETLTVFLILAYTIKVCR